MRIGAKLVVCGAVIVAAAAYAVWLGASAGWQYYLHVDECVARAEHWRGKRLRVEGKVASGSLAADPGQRRATFVLEGKEHTLAVSFRGTVPDNLAEGRAVVAEGMLDGPGQLRAETVITRCASKYAAEDQAAGDGAADSEAQAASAKAGR